jgi:beta-lactamase superfamily II metal-dependent hydrolase
MVSVSRHLRHAERSALISLHKDFCMPSSASLEIHVLNVGQGDSVLVVNRDQNAVKAAITKAKGAPAVPANPIDYVPYAMANGVPLLGTVKKALLIDGGDDEYGGDVVSYLTAHGVLDPGYYNQGNLSLLLSHYHDDHMAGLRSVFKELVPATKTAAAKLIDRYRPGAVYQAKFTKKSKPPSLRFVSFQSDVRNAAAKSSNPTKQVYVSPGGRTADNKANVTIDLGTGVNGIPISVVLLAAAQAVWDAGKKKVVSIASTGKTVDQNDRSIVAVLQYGSFRCLLGGDIAGDGGPAGGNNGANDGSGGKAFFSQHADVESTLGPALEAYFPATKAADYKKAGVPKFTTAGYCTVMKANHHGSSSSVDVYLLATVQPLVFVASSGVKARFHDHPTQAVLNRITLSQSSTWGVRPKGKKAPGTVGNTINGRYVTEIAQKVNNVTFGVNLYAAKIMGDTVIRPVDETVAAVQAATAAGQTLTVQVYGTGDQTTITDPDTTLRPTGPVSPAPALYRIGPFLHSDTH